MGRAPDDGPARGAGSSAGAVLTVPADSLVTDLSPLSCTQQRLWLAAQSAGGGSGYHLGWVVHLAGDLDVIALRAALGELVSRHEILRCWLLDSDGLPAFQVAAPGPVHLPVVETTAAAAQALARDLVSRPFAVGAGPLWRAALYQTGPASHQLALAAHHVILDASTAGLLFGELAAAYRAWRQGHPPSLPPAVPYSAYCAWEREFLRTPECAARVTYWLGQAAGVPLLELPADRPRLGGGLPRRGAMATRTIPADTVAALRRLARAQSGSLSHVLLAGYAAVLHRYSGSGEFAVGVPVSTRRGLRWANSAGLYVNTLPIRVRLATNPPFEQLVREVRDMVLAALGTVDVPLDEVTAAMRASRPAGAQPLYNVTFGTTAGGPLCLDLPDLTTRVTPVYGGHAKFDLHLEAFDRGQDTPLRFVLEYDAGQFTRSAARRILRSLCVLLAAAAAAPGRTVGALPLWDVDAADAAERALLLRDVDAADAADRALPLGGVAAANGSAARSAAVAAVLTGPSGGPGPLPGGGRVDVLLATTAAASPVQVALVDAASGDQLRYAELAGLASGIAAELAARGVRPGHFVGITLPRSVDLVVAIAGVLTAGAAYVPLDADYPVARLAEMISTAGVRLVIGPLPDGIDVPVMDLPRAAPHSAGLPSGGLAGAGPPGAGPPTADLLGAGAPVAVRSAADPAYVMFTSGSTGQPKAVVVPHEGIVRLVSDTSFAQMTSDQRWLHASSPSFDGSTLELWAALLNGGTLVVLTGPPTVEKLGDAFSRHRVTAAWLTSGLFNLVVDTDVNVLAPLRQVIVGGEAVSAGHVRRALRVVPTVINGYGPTENTSFTTCHVMRSARAVASPVPIGRPVRGTVVQVVDAYLNPMPPGAIGEIVTGGQGLATGYAGAPGLTAERFVPSMFGPPGARLYRTGDYGWIGPSGILHFVGRRDNQVKVRGFRVELGATEHALLGHPGVTQAAVTVQADPTGDSRLVGYTVGPAGAGEITDYLRKKLPEYMIPAQWVRLDALPLGPTGKVDRRALPVPRAQAAADPGAAATAVERDLIEWCRELLGVASVGPDSNFLAVGGHSLLAVRLLNRIRTELDVEVSLSAILGSPRLADLAAVVSASQQARGLPEPVGRPARPQTRVEG